VTNWLFPLFLTVLVLLLVLSAGIGPANGGGLHVRALLSNGEESDLLRQVVWQVRVPRFLLGVLVGSALGASGSALQGLFRNRLADPGIIGVTAGASFSVVLVLALASFGWIADSPVLMIVAGFVGALLAAFAAFRLGSQGSSHLLLAGIGINALCMAATGLVIALIDDQTLRTFTFWSMGSLAGAEWRSLLVAIPFLMLPIAVLIQRGRALNLMVLGDGPAQCAGLDVGALRRSVFVLTAMLVATAISLSGSIGFVGLVVPNALRLWLGEDQRRLMVYSSLLGAVLLVTADLLARTVQAPLELPVGVITALCGAPFFLYLLRRPVQSWSAA
jgi:iron complex transport system permease protein